MQKFLNLFISGTVTGAIYSIMAAGLVLTYETSGVFNFAHAAVAFSSAYFYFQLNTGQGIPIVPSAIITVCHFCPAARIGTGPHRARPDGKRAHVRPHRGDHRRSHRPAELRAVAGGRGHGQLVGARTSPI